MNKAEKIRTIAELCWWYDAWSQASFEGAGRTPGRKSLELHLNIGEAEVLELMESDAYFEEIENLMCTTRSPIERALWLENFTKNSNKRSKLRKRLGLSEEKISKLIERGLNSEPNLHEIREALIAYIDRESHVLEFDDFGPDSFIGYSCGYGHYEIWLAIWIGTNLDIISTSLRFGKEHHNTFERLKEIIDKIDWLFPEEEVDYKSFSGDIQGIVIEKPVDLSQQENWDEISAWVRENLEKLLYVIRIH